MPQCMKHVAIIDCLSSAQRRFTHGLPLLVMTSGYVSNCLSPNLGSLTLQIMTCISQFSALIRYVQTRKHVLGANPLTTWSRTVFCRRMDRKVKRVRTKVRGLVGNNSQIRPAISEVFPKLTPRTMFIPASRSAVTTISADVPETHVPGVTSVPGALVQIPSIGVLGVNRIRLSTHTHLRREAWAYHLASHPDKAFSGRILRYLDEGVPILYEGPDYNRVCPTWRSVEVFRSAVEKTIKEDIALGRKSGPFSTPPLANLVGSP